MKGMESGGEPSIIDRNRVPRLFYAVALRGADWMGSGLLAEPLATQMQGNAGCKKGPSDV